MRKLFFLSVTVLLFAACSNHNNGSTGSSEAFIPTDSANKMINSYLNSISYQSNDTDLRSLIIDADAMRDYLTSPEGQGISNMKIMFAHTLDYINGGGQNQPCGMHSGALTVIIAGYTKQGDYVYRLGNVLNHAMPCPNLCPTAGQAASDTLNHYMNKK